MRSSMRRRFCLVEGSNSVGSTTAPISVRRWRFPIAAASCFCNISRRSKSFGVKISTAPKGNLDCLCRFSATAIFFCRAAASSSSISEGTESSSATQHSLMKIHLECVNLYRHSLILHPDPTSRLLRPIPN
uniref:Uncharacterized protein n=1 Tax=Spongospora subterranea TaxID=70186 RepID=A0A0H5QSE2_9EUKA|eukprot:CRZ04588.1 hypothetical protein [Spongospora subterranea]